jgi:hypothetical protein
MAIPVAVIVAPFSMFALGILLHLPLDQPHNLVGLVGNGLVVSDHDNGQPALGVERAENRQDFERE